MQKIKANIERLRRDIGEISQMNMLAKGAAADRILCQVSVLFDQIGGELERLASRLAVVEANIMEVDKHGDTPQDPNRGMPVSDLQGHHRRD